MKNTTLIIGGGVVGATLALKLAQARHPVTLIDARPKPVSYTHLTLPTNREV